MSSEVVNDPGNVTTSCLGSYDDRGVSCSDNTDKAVQSLWNKIYDSTIGNVFNLPNLSRRAVGSVVRDLFFFPLKFSLIGGTQKVQNIMQREEGYFTNFWDKESPLDPALTRHFEIREHFEPPKEKNISIPLKNGKTVTMTCSVIESKTACSNSANFYNFVKIPGVYSTIKNDAIGMHSYLESYLKLKEAKPNETPSTRFIVISENNLDYKPESLEEAGEILLKTLRELKEEFGEIDQIVAHSLGVILFSSALKQVEQRERLAKNICLDRGPSSIKEACKKYPLGLNYLIYLSTIFGKWTLDIEQTIINFYEQRRGRVSLLVVGVENDHHFSGKANLCLGEKIDEIDGIQKLIFNPPRQISHIQNHHAMQPGLLNRCYQINDGNEFMRMEENLADAIIRNSMLNGG